MIDILFENDDMIVLNKPAGLFSIPDRFGKEASLKSLLPIRLRPLLLFEDTILRIVPKLSPNATKHFNQQ